MKGKVTLARLEGPQDVDAELWDHLAVHKPAEPERGGWVVTHRPTGLAMAFVDLKRQATGLAAMWEGEHAADLKKLATLEFNRAPAKGTRAHAACRRLYRARQQWMVDNG